MSKIGIGIRLNKALGSATFKVFSGLIGYWRHWVAGRWDLDYTEDGGLTWTNLDSIDPTETTILRNSTYRYRIVDYALNVDQTLTATGYAGIAGTDWENLGIFSGLNWVSKCNFLVDKEARNGLILPDSVSGNDAQILPACLIVDGSNYALRTVANFGNVASGYVESYVKVVDGSNTIIFSSSDTATNSLHIYLYISTTRKPTIVVKNYATVNGLATTAAITEGWHKVKFVSTGSAYQIWVDDISVALTVGSGLDDGRWMTYVTGRDNIGIGRQSNLNTPIASSGTGLVAWVDFNASNKWYLTGVGKYEYDVIGGAHLTRTGTTTKYDAGGSVQLLDIGYTLYTKVTEPDEYVPYVSAGVPYDASALLVGYATEERVPNDLTNLAPALIDFDPTGATPAGVANYDLSNATQWSDLARAWTGYDAAHPYRIPLLTVFDPVVYYNWRNVNYERMIFTGGDRVGVVPSSLSEIMSFATNRTEAEAIIVNNYLGR